MNVGGPGQAGGPSPLQPNWWPADPRRNSSSASDVMSQLCRVCGEPAAGFHFGAFTCEGCKSFFGRTYNNLGSITECKNNNECVINKKNRTSCKACRLRKCLAVGMSKSGSRYGRRSNWFKIHCLLQEQHQHHQQQQHHHQHQNHRLQHQLQQQPRSQQQPVASGDGGAPLQRIQLVAAVPGGPRPDADNNNYCAVAGGDPDKNVARSAVPPELLLRWASPFFPVFPPFPPPGPFFPRELRAARRTSVEREPPTRSTGRSPASRSSADRDDDDDEDRDDGRASPGGVRLPPVQESPMDLSASAAPLRSPSPPDVRGRRTTDPCPADRSGSRRRMRRRRRRRRRRRSGPSDDRSTPSDGSESFSDGSESSGGGGGGGERPAKSSPLDLTCVPPRS